MYKIQKLADILKLVFCVCGFLFFSTELLAQNRLKRQNVKDSIIRLPLIEVGVGAQFPQFDMADRFKNNYSVNGSFLIKDKKNWIFGFDASFIYNDEIKEEGVLSRIMTPDGGVINLAGEYADVFLQQRGFTFHVKGGKQWPILGPNPNCGFFATAGVGMLQHKVRILDVQSTSASLSGDYKKGYDRMANGICLQQSIGYRYLSNNRLINFYISIDAMQGFTQGRRTFNFDTLEPGTEKRRDDLIGFRAGWIIALYKKMPKEFYFN